VRDVKAGDELFRHTGEWHNIRREIDCEIDCENNRYFKHITDGNGTIGRHVEEPLIQHRGYGSAKRKRHTDV
jgi:hypothetical protein